jgi:serine/threonine protein kinase
LLRLQIHAAFAPKKSAAEENVFGKVGREDKLTLKMEARREAGILRLVSGCAHVVQLVAAITDVDCVWIFMENGGDDLEKGAPTRKNELVLLAEHLFVALTHIHARGVVHGDVKPSNVVRGQSAVYKLVDFGSAAVVGAELPSSALRGASQYRPPELAERHNTATEKQSSLPLSSGHHRRSASGSGGGGGGGGGGDGGAVRRVGHRRSVSGSCSSSSGGGNGSGAFTADIVAPTMTKGDVYSAGVVLLEQAVRAYCPGVVPSTGTSTEFVQRAFELLSSATDADATLQQLLPVIKQCVESDPAARLSSDEALEAVQRLRMPLRGDPVDEDAQQVVERPADDVGQSALVSQAIEAVGSDSSNDSVRLVVRSALEDLKSDLTTGSGSRAVIDRVTGDLLRLLDGAASDPDDVALYQGRLWAVSKPELRSTLTALTSALGSDDRRREQLMLHARVHVGVEATGLPVKRAHRRRRRRVRKRVSADGETAVGEADAWSSQHIDSGAEATASETVVGEAVETAPGETVAESSQHTDSDSETSLGEAVALSSPHTGGETAVSASAVGEAATGPLSPHCHGEVGEAAAAVPHSGGCTASATGSLHTSCETATGKTAVGKAEAGSLLHTGGETATVVSKTAPVGGTDTGSLSHTGGEAAAGVSEAAVGGVGDGLSSHSDGTTATGVSGAAVGEADAESLLHTGSETAAVVSKTAVSGAAAGSLWHTGGETAAVVREAAVGGAGVGLSSHSDGTTTTGVSGAAVGEAEAGSLLHTGSETAGGVSKTAVGGAEAGSLWHTGGETAAVVSEAAVGGAGVGLSSHSDGTTTTGVSGAAVGGTEAGSLLHVGSETAGGVSKTAVGAAVTGALLHKTATGEPIISEAGSLWHTGSETAAGVSAVGGAGVGLSSPSDGTTATGVGEATVGEAAAESSSHTGGETAPGDTPVSGAEAGSSPPPGMAAGVVGETAAAETPVSGAVVAWSSPHTGAVEYPVAYQVRRVNSDR